MAKTQQSMSLVVTTGTARALYPQRTRRARRPARVLVTPDLLDALPEAMVKALKPLLRRGVQAFLVESESGLEVEIVNKRCRRP